MAATMVFQSTATIPQVPNSMHWKSKKAEHASIAQLITKVCSLDKNRDMATRHPQIDVML